MSSPFATLQSKPQRAGTPPMKVAAIIPAYNEEARIAAVLQTLARSSAIDEIIVVNDGSADATASVAGAVPGVQVITLPRNKGKGGAMREGATRTEADVLLFFDADLIGLTPEHVSDLLAPVCAGEATMAMGIFRGGRLWTDMAQFFAPAITGQRAILREVFLHIPDLEAVGYGIELAINDYVHSQGLIRRDITLRGVTHPMKEEKLGWARGAASRSRMYWQMLQFQLSRRGHKKDKQRKKPGRD
ncbi:MAG: glycosyltransferase family 2 protein [Armatimonadota bacterium]|nr:glycosyltransferase family 2 protein [Armatimonadota bacterium]